jgi:hypothetical protein
VNFGDVITGTVDGDDQVDFFHYSGLTAGSFFDVFVELTDPAFGNGPIFTDVSDTGLNQLPGAFDTINANPPTGVHLTGTVPANGQIVVQVSYQDNRTADPEGYRISLTQRTAGVPMPASLALVAAGLVGLGGVHVARRRKKPA